MLAKCLLEASKKEELLYLQERKSHGNRNYAERATEHNCKW